MGVYRLDCIDRDTGKEGTMQIEALSESDAIRQANADGWMVGRVLQLEGPDPPNPPRKNTLEPREYAVVLVSEGGLSFFLFGQANVPLDKLFQILNRYGAEGWTLEFMFTERRRFLLFWGREAVIVTFSRPR